MANMWLRLWHDMPTDPKWKTVARHSKQPISLVLSVYLHLMVDASRNVTRGHVTVTTEDIASALDCDDTQVQAILDAMQGRVLEGHALTGWERRQPKREDAGNPESGALSASERKRAERARRKQQEQSAESHAPSRNVTTDKDTDKDTEAEESKAHATPNIPEQPNSDPPTTSPASRACMAMIAAGIPKHRINHSHAKLLDALDEGVTPQEFADAVPGALAANAANPFVWAITVARGEHANRGSPPPAARGSPPGKTGAITQDFDGITY